MRKEWKRNGRKALKKHYFLFVFICLVMAIMGLDYTSSLDGIQYVSGGGTGTAATASDTSITATPAAPDKAAATASTGSDASTAAENTGSSAESAASADTPVAAAPAPVAPPSGMPEDIAEDAETHFGQGIHMNNDELCVTIGGRDFYMDPDSYVLRPAVKQNTEEEHIGIVSVGHTRGVLAEIVNMSSNQTLLNMIIRSLHSIVHSQSWVLVIAIIISGIFYWLVQTLIFGTANVGIKRFFLQSRIYDDVPIKDTIFLTRVRAWTKVMLAVLVEQIYMFFWNITVIGGIIKSFSYFAVPYILAENPTLSPSQAITLSRNMMYGHKWEAFKLNVSFFGWQLLSFITLGFSGMLYSSPYEEATMAEYYTYIRECARENQIEGIDLLQDTYLFTKADPEMLRPAYEDLHREYKDPNELYKNTNIILRLITRVLGVCLIHNDTEKEYERRLIENEYEKDYQGATNGTRYPWRFYTIPEKNQVKRIERLNYLKHYSTTSIILLFFSFCMVGWMWEVSLHLIADGVFVNRGVLHGPWLPIYGTGGVLILLVLNYVRKNPFVEFAAAIVVCGILEYYTGWYLEKTHDGMKWWDYSGYFLNIHGRVCAEGLLVFGLGGMLVVYLVAPLLDEYLRKIPFKIAVAVCGVLLVCYVSDQIYSRKHPNAGKGVTDIEANAAMPYDTETYEPVIDQYTLYSINI